MYSGASSLSDTTISAALSGATGTFRRGRTCAIGYDNHFAGYLNHLSLRADDQCTVVAESRSETAPIPMMTASARIELNIRSQKAQA